MAGLTLNECIEVQCNGKAISEVTELNISKCNSKSIEGLTDEYTSLEMLTLKGVGLENISGLPKLPKLKKLDLSNNMLADGFNVLLNCPELEELDLSNNKIEDISTLKPLTSLHGLHILKLIGCPIVDDEDYPEVVLSAIPQLKQLDESGEAVQNGELSNDDASGDDDDDDDGEEEEEEYGLAALQRSGELEDDDEEEDYAPGAEEEEAEFDDYDDLGDEDDDDDEIDDDGANLSGADVSGPRRPGSKRRHGDSIEHGNGKLHEDAPATKHRPTEEEVDSLNGTAVDK